MIRTTFSAEYNKCNLPNRTWKGVLVNVPSGCRTTITSIEPDNVDGFKKKARETPSNMDCTISISCYQYNDPPASFFFQSSSANSTLLWRIYPPTWEEISKPTPWVYLRFSSAKRQRNRMSRHYQYITKEWKALMELELKEVLQAFNHLCAQMNLCIPN